MATREEIENYEMSKSLEMQKEEMRNSVYAPQLHEQMSQSQAVLVEQTNPDKVMAEIYLKLKGQVRTVDGRTLTLGIPLMNDKGIDRLIILMSTIINQNTILSYLEEDEIGKIIIGIGEDIIDDLTLNWKDYGIKDKMMLDYIVDILIYPSYFALKRALQKNEKNWLKGITVENISGAGKYQPQRTSESFWSKFRL